MPPRKPYPSEKQDQYMLRLPNGMRDRLKAEAEKNRRSLSAEIVARLEASLVRQELGGGIMGKAEDVKRVFDPETERLIEALADRVARRLKP